MTVLRMKSLLLGVSMPREASRANQLGSMNDPLNYAIEIEGDGGRKKPTHIFPQSQE
jgi:hypothetical protein